MKTLSPQRHQEHQEKQISKNLFSFVPWCLGGKKLL
jgi:hypothetical protein